MQQQGDKLVCGGCGGWFIPGVVPLTGPTTAAQCSGGER